MRQKKLSTHFYVIHAFRKKENNKILILASSWEKAYIKRSQIQVKLYEVICVFFLVLFLYTLRIARATLSNIYDELLSICRACLPDLLCFVYFSFSGPFLSVPSLNFLVIDQRLDTCFYEFPSPIKVFWSRASVLPYTLYIGVLNAKSNFPVTLYVYYPKSK